MWRAGTGLALSLIVVGAAILFTSQRSSAGELIYGDASCDERVNSIDSTLVLQADAGLLDSVPCEEEADANGDGRINSIDSTLILQFDAGLIDELGPPDCHPSYAGVCLNRGASDYDCQGGSGNGPLYVDGPFQVVGPDKFELDSDNDGIGCE